MAINKGIVGIGDAGGIVPSDNFNAVLYTGDGTTGRSITTGLAADLVIIKNRSSALQDWVWFDSVRGPSEYIRSNSTSQQYNAGSGQGVSAFGSTTVTIGDNAAGNLGANGSVGGTYSGAALHAMYAFTGGGAAVSNTDGTITSQVSANVDAGFSIVSYTGTGSTATVGHGLNQPVELILVKNTSASASWAVYSAPTGINKFLELNSSGAATSYSNYWGAATPTNDVFGVVNGNFNNNATNASLIAYCFHSVDGYSKIGSYTGTGTTLQTITTGFKPAFIMFKNTDAGNAWTIMDNKRNPTNPRNLGLFPNLTNSEYTYPGTPNGLSFTSTGFTLDTGQAEFNQNNLEYIFMAFAE